MSASFPEENGWIWRNGEFIPWKDAHIHVMSHVVHYGSSVFEGIRCYRTPEGPAVLRLGDHLRRFTDSARIYRMTLKHDRDELEAASLELIDRNRLDECYLRPLAIRGYGAAGLNPSTSPVDTYLICWPWGAYLGAEALDDGVDVCVSSWQRPSPNTFPTLAKAGGHYLNAQLMKMEAVANGYAEAIALNKEGRVSEGSGQNLFMVRNGVLHTPPLDGAMLPGITRDCILTLARDLDIPVVLEAMPREALYIADELFFTGTAAEVSPIRSVDRIPVGNGKPGPVARRLQEAFLGLAKGDTPDRYGWLTPVRPGNGEGRDSNETQRKEKVSG
jgi:branched-chain amino acid aminotransferase